MLSFGSWPGPAFVEAGPASGRREQTSRQLLLS